MTARLLSLSIRAHLVILISLLAFPFVIMIVRLGINERDNAIAAAYRDNMKFVGMIANEQKSIVTGLEQLLLALSFVPEIQNHDVTATNAIVVELLKRNPHLTNIAVMDPYGIVWGTARPFMGQVSLGDRKYFLEAVRTGSLSSGEFTVGRISSKPIINFGYPVKDQSKQVIAVLGIALDLEYIRRDFRSMNFPAGSSFRVLDHNGVTLLGDLDETAKTASIGKPGAPPEQLDRMQTGPEEGFFEGNGPEGDRRLIAYQKMGLPGEPKPYLYILSSIPRAEVISRANAMIVRNLSTLTAVFLIGLFSAWFIGSRVIASPINLLKQASKRLGSSLETVNVSSEVKGGELGELALAFDEMADALVRRELAQSAAEAALRESERKFRNISERSFVGIFVLQEDVIRYANGTLSEILGYETSELVDRMSPIDLVVPEDWPAVREKLVGLASGKWETQFHSFRIVTNLGEIRQVETYSSRTTYGGSSAIIGTLLDVSDRKRIQDELLALIEKNQAALQIASMGHWEYDMASRMFTFNDQYYSLHGVSAEEAGGYRMDADAYAKRFVHPEDAHLVKALIQEAAESREPKFQVQCEARILRAGGEVRDVSVWFRAEKNARGKTVRLHGVNQDITERMRAEAIVRENEALLSSIVENLPLMIFMKDAAELRFVRFNRAGEALLGYSREDLIGKSDYELFPPEQADFFTQEDREVLESGQLRDIAEEPIATRRGERFLHTKKIPILDKEGKPVYLLGISEDITDRKLAEEEKVNLQAQLSQSQKLESVGRLAGGVAHDFNNMLSAILGHAQLAMMRGRSAEMIQQDLKTIEDSALRSADLIRKLLAFARKQTIVPKVLDLNETVAGMLKMLQRLIGEDVDFAWVPAESLWPVRIDPSQVDQLLVNLCVNARDAISGVGKVTIEVGNAVFDEAYCTVHAGYSPGEFVMLAVSDDGCGMDKEVLGHIFEPFFTSKELGKGTGLGLATVYGIVKQNDGFINVYSEPGKGSTFKLYLPRFQGDLAEPALEDTDETPLGHGETVLLVEDEPRILSVGRAMLEALGYKVLTAGTPTEAVRELAAHVGEVRLLITDVIMPEMNGRELATLLCGMQPGLKCLFASGYAANVTAHRGVLDEGVYFIPKPFSVQQLAAKVQEAMGCAGSRPIREDVSRQGAAFHSGI